MVPKASVKGTGVGLTRTSSMSGRDDISLLLDQEKGYRLSIPYVKCLEPQLFQILEVGFVFLFCFILKCLHS